MTTPICLLWTQQWGGAMVIMCCLAVLMFFLWFPSWVRWMSGKRGKGENNLCPFFLSSLSLAVLSLRLAFPLDLRATLVERLVFTRFWGQKCLCSCNIGSTLTQRSVEHLKYVVHHLLPPKKKKIMLCRTKDGGKSCQLAANETSLWRYPNLQGANVYDSPPPTHTHTPSTCASPICPCTQPLVWQWGQLWGPLCDYSHMAMALVLWAANRRGRKKCLTYG